MNEDVYIILSVADWRDVPLQGPDGFISREHQAARKEILAKVRNAAIQAAEAEAERLGITVTGSEDRLPHIGDED